MTSGGILHVVAPASVGGLERVVHALARGHKKRGHDVRVAALVGDVNEAQPFLEPLHNANVPVDTLPVNLFNVLAERQFVTDICARHRPRVVHTHGYRPDIVDSGVPKSIGIPVLSTEHGMSKMGGRTAIYEWLQLRSLRRVDAVAAVSRPIVRALSDAGVSQDRIHLIPNAWADDVSYLSRTEARSALGLPADEIIVGFMGRLIRAKGADLFVEALRLLGSRVPKAALIGGGPETEAIQQAITSSGLSKSVRMLGPLDGGARYLKAFDMFVLSSRTEGTPIVLFEALAAGVPVVATKVGGVPDVVNDESAELCDPENPESLSRAIGNVLENSTLVQHRCVRARTTLDLNYGINPWLERYESLYESLSNGTTGNQH